MGKDSRSIPYGSKLACTQKYMNTLIVPRFSECLNTWFDVIAERFKTRQNKEQLLNQLRTTHNSANMQRLVELMKLDTDLAEALPHAMYVACKAFKNEFRYSFSKTSQQTSAASEFFNLLKQAVVYHGS